MRDPKNLKKKKANSGVATAETIHPKDMVNTVATPIVIKEVTSSFLLKFKSGSRTRLVIELEAKNIPLRVVAYRYKRETKFERMASRPRLNTFADCSHEIAWATDHTRSSNTRDLAVMCH